MNLGHVFAQTDKIMIVQKFMEKCLTIKTASKTLDKTLGKALIKTTAKNEKGRDFPTFH